MLQTAFFMCNFNIDYVKCYFVINTYALFSCALHDVDVASAQGSRVGAKTRALRQKPGKLGNVIFQYVKRLTIYYILSSPW